MARFPQPVQVIAGGPFKGMNDATSLSAQNPNYYKDALNVYLPDVIRGGDVMGRPGFSTRVNFVPGTALTGTVQVTASNAIVGTGTLFTTQVSVGDTITVDAVDYIVRSVTDATNLVVSLASTGGTVTTGSAGLTATRKNAAGIAGPLYHVAQHTRTDGVSRTFVVGATPATAGYGAAGAAGEYAFNTAAADFLKLSEYTPSASPTLKDVTSTTMDGVALSKTSRIYSVSFANYWIISDGVNRPRKIDAASAPYVLSNLTDRTTAFYGPMAVYYGKLFGIDAATRASIHWSDENDPDIGYTGENAWELRQTSADQLSALAATNDALYVFRETSITAITGAANEDFQSAGTLDAVSQTVGTKSPNSVCLVGSEVWFWDNQGRPGKIVPGAGYIPLYDKVKELLRTTGTTDSELEQAWARFVPDLNIVLFGYQDGGSFRMLAFDARTSEPISRWTLGSVAPYTAALTSNANDRSVLTLLSQSPSDVAIYPQGVEDFASEQLDVPLGVSAAVSSRVDSAWLGGDIALDKNFERVDLTSRDLVGSEGAVNVSYTTSYRTAYSTAQSAGLVTIGTDYPDKRTVGINAYGRYISVRCANNASVNNNRLILGEVSVLGFAVSSDPKVK